MSRIPAVVLLALAVLFARPTPGAEPKADLSVCGARFATAPDAEDSAKCFYDLGRESEDPEPVRRMRQLLARHPGHPWLSLYLAHLMSREPEQAAPLYRDAAAGFALRRLPRGEVIARSNLQRILDEQGRADEAGREAERAEQVAEASGDAELIARAKVVRARHLFLLGQDLERVYLLLRRAEESAFPDGPYSLRRECLIWLGTVSLETGRSREAQVYFRQLVELTEAEGDSFAEANARYNLARAYLDGVTELPRPGQRDRAIALARQALVKSNEGRHTGIQAKSHWLLGLLLTGEEAHGHLDQCLEVADTLRDRSYCLNALARHLAVEDPQRAREAAQEALSLAHEAEDPWGMAYAWREQMRASWAGGSREQAVADSRAALEAIESLRDLQGGTASRVGLFSSFSEYYSWFSGRVLETWAAQGGAENLDSAFGTTEQMRARTLLDALNAAQAAPTLPAEARPLQQRVAKIHEEISLVQRRLLDPALPAADRKAAQTSLERLELEETDLRGRIAQASPALSALRTPDSFATLAEVRTALAPDEALLSFQIAPDRDLFGDFAGGSWLLVSTRDGNRAYRLRRDRVALRPAVELFTGLFSRRDGSEAGPGAGLYRDLLADALRDLPSGVRRLVIIPDDALHQLPFTALRASKEAPPLIERYEISLVPSATLWLHWERRPPDLPGAPLLALADPVPPGGEKGWLSVLQQPAVSRERAAMFGEAVRLGSLPHARREGRSAVRQLGGESLLRVGDEASEGFLKRADLRRFSILHFATHAVVDSQNPERSGVLLTPAPASEDGLLQIREIVPLTLDGRIVVLSSCRSASGTVLRGEGVMGLARAFFQAGAQTVIASLWPLRDDDGAALFDRFYHHLAEGLSVSAALRAAQLDRIADGAPAYAWAGLVVLGEGDLVPMPEGRPRRMADPWVWTAGGGLALLTAAGVATWSRRRRKKSPVW
jgi:CHAT domain-containing protein/tetratricopeptide (TPR) repeat protein